MNRGRVTRNDLDLDREAVQMRHARILRQREEVEEGNARILEYVREIAMRANANGREFAMFVRRGQDVHEVDFMGAQEGRDALLDRIQAAMHRFEARRGTADKPVACGEVEVD